VGSLLTLARADAGEIPLASEAVDLGGLVAGAVEQVRPAAEGKEIEVWVEPGPAVTLRADEDLLLQLVLNLLDNAIKYSGRGGRVAVGWAAEERGARLWVTDTGAGIAPEHVGHVFDRFYRVDRARGNAEGGAGLGLSICRWIARAHGGDISLTSEAGRGTNVQVRLPAS
jgi:signal transduction histidine kinase